MNSLHTFTVKLYDRVQSIRVRKQMSPVELTDALSVAFELSGVKIVGFRDESGTIITPSQVCSDPEYLKTEIH